MHYEMPPFAPIARGAPSVAICELTDCHACLQILAPDLDSSTFRGAEMEPIIGHFEAQSGGKLRYWQIYCLEITTL